MLSFVFANAQKAKKNYEFTDTRKKTETYAKLPPDIRADLASFTFSGIDESIGKKPLQKIPFTAFGEKYMTFEGDDIKATLTTSAFEAWKHKLDYDEQYIIKIDKKPYYGGYGAMPKNYLSKITMTIGKDSVIFPPAAYTDLNNLNFTYNDKSTQRSASGIYKSQNGHRVYLYFFCKDNTGSYEVTWIIQDKRFVRRVLDYDFM